MSILLITNIISVVTIVVNSIMLIASATNYVCESKGVYMRKQRKGGVDKATMLQWNHAKRNHSHISK